MSSTRSPTAIGTGVALRRFAPQVAVFSGHDSFADWGPPQQLWAELWPRIRRVGQRRSRPRGFATDSAVATISAVVDTIGGM
jgi:hypothetical protein